jgi:hypothetical protein
VKESFSFEATADMDGDGRDEILARAPFDSPKIHVLSHFDTNLADETANFETQNGPARGADEVRAAAFTRGAMKSLVGITSFSASVLLPETNGGFRFATEGGEEK